MMAFTYFGMHIDMHLDVQLNDELQASLWHQRLNSNQKFLMSYY